MKKLLCILLTILLIPTTFAFVGCGTAYNKLGEKEKKIYDIIIDFSYDFKNPSSVRIVSGYYDEIVLDDENCYVLYCKISAENSYGATTTSAYQIEGLIGSSPNKTKNIDEPEYQYEPWLTSWNFVTGLSKHTDDFDISAVNKALKEYWEKKMG